MSISKKKAVMMVIKIYEFKCRGCGKRYAMDDLTLILDKNPSDLPMKRCPDCRGVVDYVLTKEAEEKMRSKKMDNEKEYNEQEELEAEFKKDMANQAVSLADLRKWQREQAVKIANLQEELKAAAPKIVEDLEKAQSYLTELNKQVSSKETYIRNKAVDFPEISLQTPWLDKRYPTVVTYLEEVALKLAAVFCPDAITLNKSKFESWAKKRQDNPTFANYFQVKQVPGFTIKTDLTAYETKIEELEIEDGLS